jgi:hypothetical protein
MCRLHNIHTNILTHTLYDNDVFEMAIKNSSCKHIISVDFCWIITSMEWSKISFWCLFFVLYVNYTQSLCWWLKRWVSLECQLNMSSHHIRLRSWRIWGRAQVVIFWRSISSALALTGNARREGGTTGLDAGRVTTSTWPYDVWGMIVQTKKESILIGFAAGRQMTMKSTYFMHKRIHIETWYSPNGRTGKQIGHCLIDERHFSDVSTLTPQQLRRFTVECLKGGNVATMYCH